MVAFVQNIILDVQILNDVVLKIKDIDIDIFSVTNFFNVILFTLYVSSSVIPNSCRSASKIKFLRVRGNTRNLYDTEAKSIIWNSSEIFLPLGSQKLKLLSIRMFSVEIYFILFIYQHLSV